MEPGAAASIRSRIQRLADEMTGVDRKLAAIVLGEYPFNALVPIHELATVAKVSTPSVTRFVNKLGCAGYQEFQRQLLTELRERDRGPKSLRETEDRSDQSGFLNSYAQRAGECIRRMTDFVSESELEAVCALLGDVKRSVFVMGGRVSDALAHVLCGHLRFMRPNVHHVGQDPEVWPDTLQQIRARDIVVLLDFRRYQKSTNDFAVLAKEWSNPTLVLITDEWLSPISAISSRILPTPIAVGTPWDSLTASLALIEALIAKISTENWDAIEPRLNAWEKMRPTFDHDTRNQDREEHAN